MMNKKGRWTNAEHSFIRKNIGTMPLEQLALELQRPIEALIKYKRDHYGNVTQKEIKEDLHDTPEWVQLKYELTDDELKYFEHRFAKLKEQFLEDILPTEETQIFQLIKFEVLMARNMKDRKRAIFEQEVIQKELDKLRRISQPNMQEIERMRYLMEQINAISMSASTKSSEYMGFQGKHENILKNLRATREQRIKNVEGRRKNLIDVIKSLEDKEYKAELGKDLALMQKATKKELERLSQFHEYGENVIDKPILSYETV